MTSCRSSTQWYFRDSFQCSIRGFPVSIRVFSRSSPKDFSRNSKIPPGISKIKIILDVLKGYFSACPRHSFRYAGKSSSQHQFHDSFNFFRFIDYPVFEPGILGVSPEILSNISPRISSEVPPGIPVLFMGLLSGILPEIFNCKISWALTEYYLPFQIITDIFSGIPSGISPAFFFQG